MPHSTVSSFSSETRTAACGGSPPFPAHVPPQVFCFKPATDTGCCGLLKWLYRGPPGNPGTRVPGVPGYPLGLDL
eukprot:1225026-Rhodomonas_salina.1